MSNLIFYTGYIFFISACYIPSLLASRCWSGHRFSIIKFLVVDAYNVFCIYIHMRYVERGVLPVVGEKDNDVLGWASFVMIFIHAVSTPMPWERKKLKFIGKYFKS